MTILNTGGIRTHMGSSDDLPLLAPVAALAPAAAIGEPSPSSTAAKTSCYRKAFFL